MANKEKLHISVQKYLEKGRISKAIGVLEKIVKDDPKDIRCLLKMAELYAQEGKRDKAVETYEGIAEFYLKNSFSLKAIAVFKQILKLAPDRKELHKKLGELNEQQGLRGNALSEYRALAEYYQQQEMLSETRGVLKKIAELDPNNASIRMRVAEYSFRLDARDEAKKELDQVYAILQEKEDHPALGKFYEFYLSLFPDEFTIELAAAERKLLKESPEAGIEALENLRQKRPQDIGVLKMLAHGYGLVKKLGNVKSILKELLSLCPHDLDLCQKCVHACMAADDQAGAVEILKKEAETFQAQNRVSELQDLYEQLAEEFSENPKNEIVFSSLRSIIKSTADFSQGVDFGSYAHLPEEKDDHASFGSFLGTEDNVEEVLETIGSLDEGEEFVLETSEEPEGGFNLSAPVQDLSAAATGGDKPAGTDTGPSESESGGEFLEFEDGFFDFDLAEDDSDPKAGAAVPDHYSELEEADFYLRQGLFKEAERVCQKILEVQPDFKEAKDKLAQIGEKHSESLAMANQSGAPGEDAASENISIDLFSQEGGEDFFLDGLVADSQKGVKTVIGQEDTESHYNLGIAYKEMGQFDEAISEFEQAKMDSLRYVDCLNLIAGCMIQKGSFAEAEKVFLDALADNISDDDRIILNFEMGVFYSEQEKFAKALDKFHFVLNLNPFYRDVGERVKKLQEKMGGEGDSPDNENMSSNRRKSRISYV